MQSATISVVIPTFNRGHLVGRAVESALAQTYLPLEIIVVDDGSTDDTADRVRAFGGNVRHLHQANRGASSARNRGVHEAKGVWVGFLDSDDVWFPDHLRRIAAAIAATVGKAGFYFADFLEARGPAGGGLWEHCRFQVGASFAYIEDATAWAMLERQPMMLQSSVFHRERLIAAGGLWEKLWTTEDTHLFLKMSIGMPACAVAGFGGEMLDDDLPARRLSLAHGVSNPRHWQSALLLWNDVLERFPGLPPHYRQILMERGATSHRNLAAIALRNRQFRHFFKEALAYGRQRFRTVVAGRSLTALHRT
jgi:glycosyltransferase involved in cell wall biosynthesis